MTDADWLRTILAAAGVLIVAWATWISRSVAGSLSRKEHKELCEERGERVDCDLAEIKQMIRDNNRDAIDSRHKIAQRVQELSLDVALLGRRSPPDEDPPERRR